jgi:hypothetical protein
MEKWLLGAGVAMVVAGAGLIHLGLMVMVCGVMFIWVVMGDPPSGKG